MFDFCGVPGYSLTGLNAVSCYFAFHWALIMVAILLLGLFTIACYLYWNQGTSVNNFRRTFSSLMLSPVKNTFCQHLSASALINSICFYCLILASIFTVSLIRIPNSLNLIYGNSSNTLAFIGNVLSAFFLIVYFFLILVAMEVISQRSHYIKKNKLNLLSSTVHLSERKPVARFIFKKALTFSLILFASELIPLTLFNNYQAGSKLIIIIRFLQGALILFMGIPKLRLLNYEKLLMEQSRDISRRSHQETLIMRYFQEIHISGKSIVKFLDELMWKTRLACPNCDQKEKICTHVIHSLIEDRINMLREKFVEQQNIASSSGFEMLPTNPRNTVGCLKVILIVILIDFAVNTVTFGLFAISGNTTGVVYQVALFAQLGFRFLRYFSTPIFMWMVLDVKKAFGEFHSVLDRSEHEGVEFSDGVSLRVTSMKDSDQRYSSFEQKSL